MNHKLIGGIFAVLYLLCVIPFPFTKGAPGILIWVAAFITGILVDINGCEPAVCFMGL